MMRSDKLLTLLLHLSRTELARLRKFLLSPYHNEQPDLTRLYALYERALRLQEDKSKAAAMLEKKSMWQRLYP